VLGRERLELGESIVIKFAGHYGLHNHRLLVAQPLPTLLTDA
jgi:hypothetical protein